MLRIDLASLEPGVHHIAREVEASALEVAARESKEEKHAAGGAPGNGASGSNASGGSGASSDGGAPGSGASGEEEEEAPNPVQEDVAFGPVHVDAVVDYQPGRALVTFQARATATLTCDRTLRRFDEPLEGSYAVLFAAPGRSAPEESEEHDELRELPPGARYLDLTEAARDTLLLAIPQRKVAPGAEEEEIDTVFGTLDTPEGEPVDPRWEKLRELREDDPDD